jgi:hypothetical protein
MGSVRQTRTHANIHTREKGRNEEREKNTKRETDHADDCQGELTKLSHGCSCCGLYPWCHLRTVDFT